MSTVRLEDGRAGELVEVWECEPAWDGRNRVCPVSRSPWACVHLGRTRTGLWVRIACASGPEGGWQGARTTYEEIPAEEAAGLAAALEVEIPELAEEVV